MTHLDRYNQILADFPIDSGPLAELHKTAAQLLRDAHVGHGLEGHGLLGDKEWRQLHRLTTALRDLVDIVETIERDEVPEEDDDIPF